MTTTNNKVGGKKRVAFDIDGTLLGFGDKPRDEVLLELKKHQDAGDFVYVWSGGGLGYAKMIVNRLGLTGVEVVQKSRFLMMDICYDDQIVNLADKNIKIWTPNKQKRWERDF